MVLRHNQLRDVFVDICHKANLGVRIEAGSALTPDLSRSHPMDALVNNWIGGLSAAFDITVTSPRLCHFVKQASLQEQLLYWQSRGRTRRMTPSVIPLDGNVSLLLWRAMETEVLKPGRLIPIWPRACPLAQNTRSQRPS